MLYGYIGSMKTQSGCRDHVAEILLAGAKDLRAAGCQIYAVSESAVDDDIIVVLEVWESKAHHAASLELPETKAAIAEAMPMLTGEFTGQELNVLGGLNVNSSGGELMSD